MPMRPTQGVSFPRSGHAVVYHAAREYFQDSLIYCDSLNKAHCGCGAVPCVNPERTFSKHHDFGLLKSPGTPILKNERYLIQYRSPVWSVTSNFLVYAANHPDQDSLAGWQRFACRDVFYWNRFVDKWVLDFPDTARQPFYCVYEDLLEEPVKILREALRFLSEEPLDEEKADEAISRVGVVPRRSLTDFKYYDSAFFRELEEMARERLELLEVPTASPPISHHQQL